MQNPWIARVSDYLDGELSPAERILFEQRIGEDPELRRAVEAVRALVDRAAALGPVQPARDLWPTIAAGLGAAGATDERSRRPAAPAPRSRSRPQAAAVAAGLALMLLSAAAGWWLHGVGTPGQAGLDRTPALHGDERPVQLAAREERLAESIRELESLLLRHGDRLDPDTREAIAGSLDQIDAAIGEARRALREDPESAYLQAHIANSLERKVRLLEDATHLASKEI